MKKTTLIAIPSVLIALLLVAPSFIDWNKYKPQAQEQIKKATGFDVAMNGDLGMAILPSPTLFIENVEVGAPAGSSADHLVRLKRLDVSLALGALLSGKVDFSAVKLVEPDIALEVLADGSQNWMTPELLAMTVKKEGAAEQKAPVISLRDVRIEKGVFSYKDSKAGTKAVVVQDVSLDLGADTLQGPFKVSGSFGFSGQTVEIKATGAKLEAGADSIGMKADVTLKPLNISVQYAGVAGLTAPFESQGETQISVASLGELTNGAIRADAASIKGLVTASQQKAVFKNAEFTLAGNSFSGDLGAVFAPLKITGDLKAAKTVDADALLSSGGAAKKQGGGAALPATLEMPVAFETDLKIAMPGLVYNKQSYKNVTLVLAKSGGNFGAGFAAGEIPGKGSIDVAGTLKYASKSTSKTGAEVYSDPSLSGTIKGQAQNIAQTIEALSGVSAAALPPSWKAGSINGGFGLKGDVIEIKDAAIKLGETNMQASVAYAQRGARPTLALDIAADTIDFDGLQQKKPEGEPKASLESSLQSIAVPMDVDFDIGIQNAKLNGQEIKGLRAQGQARENAIKFSNLSAQNYAGASFKMDGGIGDLRELKGIDVNFSGQSDDAKGVAKMAGIDPETLPQNLSAASVSGSVSGDLSAIALKAAVKALNGELAVNGDVAEPFGARKMSNMTVQVKHRNMAEGLRIFAPSAPEYASWNKPLDLSAQIDTDGKIHNLKNIKGTLAGASVAGALYLDQSGKKPIIKGDLSFGDVVMQSAPSSIGKSAAPQPAKPSGGKWSGEAIDSAWMHAFDADIAIKAKSLVYETWNLNNPVLSFNLQGGTLSIRQMESGMYGGQVAVNGTMIAPPGGKGPVSVDGSAKLQNVQIESLATSLSRGGRQVKGQGAVSMDAALKTKGNSQQALVSALSGSSTLTGRDIVLEGFDLAGLASALMDSSKPLGRLQEIVNASTAGGKTAFDTLDGQYAISNGIVNITSMTMDGPAAGVVSTGRVNLPQWTIDSNHRVTLKQAREVAPFDVKIAGPLDNPGNTFGGGMFNTILRAKVQDQIVKKLPGLLGDDTTEKLQKFGILPTKQPAPVPAPDQVVPSAGEDPVAQPSQPAAQPQPLKPEDAIEGVLKGLLSR